MTIDGCALTCIKPHGLMCSPRPYVILRAKADYIADIRHFRVNVNFIGVARGCTEILGALFREVSCKCTPLGRARGHFLKISYWVGRRVGVVAWLS